MVKHSFSLAAIVACMLALCACPSSKSDSNDAGANADGGKQAGSEADAGMSGARDDAGMHTAMDASSGDEVDAAASSDGDAASADSGSSASKPDEVGFELDGVFCPQRPNTAGCSAVSGRYFVNQGGTSADSMRAATAYVVFGGDSAPAPGEYKVNDADGATPPPAHEVSIWFNDARDMSDYWFSDGKSGTVTVVAGSGKAFDVIWHDVTLVRGAKSMTLKAGSKSESSEGWQSCMPK